MPKDYTWAHCRQSKDCLALFTNSGFYLCLRCAALVNYTATPCIF